jgi:hypothetical protein
VLTSRGKPKAALVNAQDLELREQLATRGRQARRMAWQQASKALTDEILIRRQGDPIDVDQLWQATRAELEDKDDYLFS